MHRVAAPMNAGPPLPGYPVVAIVSINDLRPGPSPRLSGLDKDHAIALAAATTALPRITVHRPTMRIIDGMHRVVACKIRGKESIEVAFFEGSEDECFLEAVRANVSHGKPLTLLERRDAAGKILGRHSDWSDRAIAEVCGLSPGTIASVRACATADSAQSRVRRGIDGRSRPLDASTARRDAAARLQQQPDASMRQIARQTGASVATVRDVRSRLNRGVNPVPQGGAVPPAVCDERTDATLDLGLNPTTGGEPTARAFADWFDGHRIRPEDWQPFVEHLPLNRLDQIISETREQSNVWQELCEQLERRLRASENS